MISIDSMIRKNRSDFLGIVLGKYPGFITSNKRNPLDNIPVFVFHDVKSADLEPFLIYLTENKYKTLTADELFDRFKHKDPIGNREIVLTFDDGEKSLRQIGFPLLKKYGQVGVAFIVPGLIPNPDKKNGWKENNQYLCDWSEIQEMHQSGVVDFQSHSMYHHSIYVSSKVVDFIKPVTCFKFPKDDILPILVSGQFVQFPDTLPLGTPLYQSDFRLKGKPQYIDSPMLREACANFVSYQGGKNFFNDKEWKTQINEFIKRIFSDFNKDAHFETLDQRDIAIHDDFKNAKKSIEYKLKGKNVKHFCFPWFVGSPTAIRISSEEGYITNFWAGVVPYYANAYSNPLAIPRLNPIYIWRLPGRGRKSLGEVLRLKYTTEVLNKVNKFRN